MKDSPVEVDFPGVVETWVFHTVSFVSLSCRHLLPITRVLGTLSVRHGSDIRGRCTVVGTGFNPLSVRIGWMVS